MLWPLLLVCLLAYRIARVFVRRQHSPGHKQTKALAVFLGSGGHTGEALAMLSALDFARYTPRTYLVSEGDVFSSQKAIDLELVKATAACPPQYSIITIPRARRVHQPLITTSPTALYSLLFCIYHITWAQVAGLSQSQSRFADVLILNGPGTCCVLCFAVLLNKFLGLAAPQTLYVESFARVQSLSLSGSLLYPFVDRFIVQWPELKKVAKRAEYHGLLV